MLINYIWVMVEFVKVSCNRFVWRRGRILARRSVRSGSIPGVNILFPDSKFSGKNHWATHRSRSELAKALGGRDGLL